DAVQPVVGWDPYQEFAELLSFACRDIYAQVAGRLEKRFSVTVLDVAALASQFVMVALPRALRRFDPVRGRGHERAWLEGVYSRYALKALSADAIHRRQLLELTQSRPAVTDEAAPGQTREALLAELTDAVKQLPRRERVALEMYYGFHGREFTIAEVAEEL